MLPLCPYIDVCSNHVQGYCEDRDPRDCSTFRDYRAREKAEQERREEEMFPILMYDIGTVIDMRRETAKKCDCINCKRGVDNCPCDDYHLF